MSQLGGTGGMLPWENLKLKFSEMDLNLPKVKLIFNFKLSSDEIFNFELN